jgi:hypothetical protein
MLDKSPTPSGRKGGDDIERYETQSGHGDGITRLDHVVEVGDRIRSASGNPQIGRRIVGGVPGGQNHVVDQDSITVGEVNELTATRY